MAEIALDFSSRVMDALGESEKSFLVLYVDSSRFITVQHPTVPLPWHWSEQQWSCMSC